MKIISANIIRSSMVGRIARQKHKKWKHERSFDGFLLMCSIWLLMRLVYMVKYGASTVISEKQSHKVCVELASYKMMIMSEKKSKNDDSSIINYRITTMNLRFVLSLIDRFDSEKLPLSVFSSNVSIFYYCISDSLILFVN